MIVIVNTKTNQVFTGLSKTEAARIVGVNRATIRFWQEKRILDQTFIEKFNYFDVYFKAVQIKQPKKGNLK